MRVRYQEKETGIVSIDIKIDAWQANYYKKIQTQNIFENPNPEHFWLVFRLLLDHCFP